MQFRQSQSRGPRTGMMRFKDIASVFARSALYVETGKTKPWKSCSSSALRKIITFCGEDLRGWTGPVRLGSLTHDSEAAPKVTSL